MARTTRTEVRLRREGRTRTKRRFVAGTTVGLLLISGGALASDLYTAYVDTSATAGELTLAPGGSTDVDVKFTVTGRQDDEATFGYYTSLTLVGGEFTEANWETIDTPPRAHGQDAPAPYVYEETIAVAVACDQPLSVEDTTFDHMIEPVVTATSGQGALKLGDDSPSVTLKVTVAGDPDASCSAGYTIDGFYQPVQNAMVNGAKAGRVIPLKFNILGGDEVKQDDIDLVDVFIMKTGCGDEDPESELREDETLSSGKTELRWDPVANQMVFNWKTPKTPACYRIKLEVDGDSVTAKFDLS